MSLIFNCIRKGEMGLNLFFGGNKEEGWKCQKEQADIQEKLESTYAEFIKKLIETRMKSAPGPNEVPYRVLKRCMERCQYQYLRDMRVKVRIWPA